MRGSYLLLALLLVTLCLPFALRPKRASHGPADATLVVITPHNEALRSEYGRGFSDWYRQKTGRNVVVDWRVIGGTSEISRFLESEYTAAFERYWTGKLGRKWSVDVQAGFQSNKLGTDSPKEAKAAREAFLTSEVSCGIDVFFGGGTYDFIRQTQAGRFIDSGIRRMHPDWFTDQTIPMGFSGAEYRDRNDLWIGSVLSSYGLLYNKDALARLNIEKPPAQWGDLTDPRYFGEIALADPTKSGSIAAVFENVIQEQMQRRLTELQSRRSGRTDAQIETEAVKEGWVDGLRLLQLIGANSRYFTDTSQKPPIDVAQGDSAVGLCIDFYGRQQAEAVTRRSGQSRLEYVSPVGGSVSSVDPIALLRGAPHGELATAFIEYVLSMDGQKLWNFRPGTPGGPKRFALRRMPVRRDFYEHEEFKPYLSDPTDNPFASSDQLVYRPKWTGSIFREMSFIYRVMCLDTHAELTRAWQAIIAAGRPAEALAVLSDMSLVNYESTNGRVKRMLGSKDKAEEIRLARELGDYFREKYAKAEAIARATVKR